MSQTASPDLHERIAYTASVIHIFIAAVASTLYSRPIGDMDLRKWVAALTNVIVFKIALSQHVRLGASRRTIFLVLVLFSDSLTTRSCPDVLTPHLAATRAFHICDFNIDNTLGFYNTVPVNTTQTGFP